MMAEVGGNRIHLGVNHERSGGFDGSGVRAFGEPKEHPNGGTVEPSDA